MPFSFFTFKTMNIDPQWKTLLLQEIQSDYFENILVTLDEESTRGKTIFPSKNNWFNSFNTCSLDKLKVVILGQDPYHGIGQAHGLSFSVPDNTPLPPSLKNIYKEIQLEYNNQTPTNGNLLAWSHQGVLLLNSALTVEAHKANSHAKIGWHQFTDRVIELISNEKQHLVFMLWGAFAQKKKSLIQGSHLILEAPHPSPLSAHRGFLGCGHFKKCNEYLIKTNQIPIEWIGA